MIFRAAGIGFVLGALWAVIARFWMRMISTEPEFSWTGTLMIIGFAGLLGMGVGLIYATRQLGRHRWLGLAILPGLMLFMSPGMLFLPAFLLGGFAWRRGAGLVGDRLLQLVGVAVLIGIPLLAWWRVRAEVEAGLAPSSDQAWAGVGFFVLSLGLAAGGSMMWKPGPKSAPVEVDLLSPDGGVVTMAGVDDSVVGQREQ